MTNVSSFQSWLELRQYSTSTIRNYLIDLDKFFQFANSREPGVVFSPEIISQYITYLSDNSNTSRYLASLNIFCQFAVDQHIIPNNPLVKIRQQSHKNTKENIFAILHKLKSEFSNYLIKHKQNPITTKNYINDINQYITWLEINKNTNRDGS